MPRDDMDADELKRRFEAAIADADLDDLRAVTARLLSLGGKAAATPPPKPSLRRKRPPHPAIFVLRVDLKGSKPPIWRRLNVRSDLTLDVVHDILQAAFGWTDSHLHRFSLGGDPFDRRSEMFLCPYDVEAGEEDGVPASDVRLDETLGEPGDQLHYVYDYGDSWDVLIRLEEVLPAAPDSPFAVCVDGRRAGPPEDSGGIPHVNELPAGSPDLSHFDPDNVNAALGDPFLLLRDAGVHPRLLRMLSRLRGTGTGDELVAMALDAVRDDDGMPDAAELHKSLRAHQWFLDRAADGGIELTSAGYLKPADVEAVVPLVPTAGAWYGKLNRESQTLPLLDFRGSLQSAGLLRKSKGRLLLTKAGTAARSDVTKLWSHLAKRLVSTDDGSFEQTVELLALVFAAGSGSGQIPLDRITRIVGGLGWREADGRPLDVRHVRWAAENLLATLESVFDRQRTHTDRQKLGPVAVALARAALRLPNT